MYYHNYICNISTAQYAQGHLMGSHCSVIFWTHIGLRVNQSAAVRPQLLARNSRISPHLKTINLDYFTLKVCIPLEFYAVKQNLMQNIFGTWNRVSRILHCFRARSLFLSLPALLFHLWWQSNVPKIKWVKLSIYLQVKLRTDLLL